MFPTRMPKNEVPRTRAGKPPPCVGGAVRGNDVTAAEPGR